ncbi:MAG: serine/threonine-protein kinase [Myxococcota bacterium]
MTATTYTLERCLGRGGYGEVYLATRRTPSGLVHRVAVKMLRADLTRPVLGLRRMRDEARLLAALEHPVIVRVLELTRLDGRVAIVMEHLEGVDVAEFGRSSRLLPRRVLLDVISDVAHALDRAWNAPAPLTGEPLRLVHRDIKPANLRITVNGTVKLLDFGIARSDTLDLEAQTYSGHFAMTPGYAAPESFLSAEQTHATDIFALTATLFRLWTGTKLFEKRTVAEQATLAIAQRPFDRFIESRLATVDGPESLKTLLRNGLAWSGPRRPTGVELQQTLEPMIEGLPAPGLRRWARDLELPPVRDARGSLVGLTLTEEAHVAVEDEPEVIAASATTVLHRSSSASPEPSRWSLASIALPLVLVLALGFGLGVFALILGVIGVFFG